MPITSKREKSSRPQFIYPKYDNRELDSFAEFLKPFYKEKTIKNFRTGEPEAVTILDHQEAMVAFGAMSKSYEGERIYYAVVVDMIDQDTIRHSVKYEMFYHKLRLLENREDRHEYAEAERIKFYDEIIGHEPEKPEDYDLPF